MCGVCVCLFVYVFICSLFRKIQKKNNKNKGTGKGVYAICNKEDVPKDVAIGEAKKISKNDLGVGILCWHSKSNFDTMETINAKPKPKPHTQLDHKRKRGKGCKSRPSKSQRQRFAINNNSLKHAPLKDIFM